MNDSPGFASPQCTDDDRPARAAAGRRWRDWYFGPQVGEPHRQGPKRWRRGGGWWLIYLLSPLGSAWTHHSLWASLTGTALLGAFALTYLFLVPKAWFAMRGLGRSYSVVALLFALSLGCAGVIGANGLTTWVYVAAALLVALPSRIALPIAGVLVVVSAIAPQYIRPWNVHGLQWGLAAGIALASLAVYGFTRLIRANQEVSAAREEVAALAAERERLRIARDLHDLLGHSLTTVTVKAALASRLIDSDPARAKAEIADVERLTRESLADVRTAVAGYREVRLATELATAREVLAAAGIDADLPTVVDDIPSDLGGLFGWVVREGVTNVVRHSRAKRVRITLDGRAIEIVDDGRGSPAGGPAEVAGHGLSGLAERAAAFGGRLVTGPADGPDDGASASGFRLRVEVPA